MVGIVPFYVAVLVSGLLGVLFGAMLAGQVQTRYAKRLVHRLCLLLGMLGGCLLAFRYQW